MLLKNVKRVIVGGSIVAAAGLALGVADEDVAVAGQHEVMTDRCSGEVAFTAKYDGKPTDHHTVILKRNKDGYSPWTTFSRNLGDDGHVRWWCHSTTGNFFDPGTWVVHVNPAGAVACLLSVAGAVATDGAASAATATCLKAVNIGSSAFEGWTPERSRCGDHSNHFRARLGPDRLLETECLGR